MKFRYNHTGTQFFEIKKNRPISGYVTTLYIKFTFMCGVFYMELINSF